ncbi:MAG: hypothetical protein JRC53_06015 [Deltaproteobacteria bacterium]|nr:hypothetical protein [Deltaproteobacteria bacterium]MBW2649346.1 hypothetical protein [Deltaproteobacteria bacterium]
MDSTYLEDRENFLSDIRAKMDKKLYGDVIVLAEARLKRFPGDMDAYLTVASCGAEMDKPIEAAEVVEQWHDIVREQSRVYEVLGDAYTRKGMSKEAIDAYIRFAALNTDPPASGRVSEKIASLQGTTIEEEDGDADMPADFHTITLAKLYMKQGHFKMAGDVLDRILESDPGNVEAGKYAEHVKRLIKKGWVPVIDELGRWLNGLREKREQ